MSEVQSRPAAPRGRGSARGGRGGYGARGGRGGRIMSTNGDKAENGPSSNLDEDGEISQLKKQHGSNFTTIKEMFPDWTDDDIVFALEETHGDLVATVEGITDGTISQWGEVSKLWKDRGRSKAKDSTTSTLKDISNTGRPSRGGRAGPEGARGGRGRGTERGRGGRGRGAPSVAQTNGSKAKTSADASVPTTESSAWDIPKQDEKSDAAAATKPSEDSWGATAADAASTATAAAQLTSSIIVDGAKKSWASMFKQAPPPPKAAVPEPAPKAVDTPSAPETIETPVEAEKEPEAEVAVPEEVSEEIKTPTIEEPEPEQAITPSKDELTETNLEQVLDTSNPAPTATQASTAASSWDPRSNAGSSTPYSALHQSQPSAIRPPTSGFAASAMKATGTSGRTPSYQRRVLDQEEAVRMPGNREVDRAAVQFGAFNLNENGDEDVDGDREEPETREQPPQHSPVSHPRAALPPATASTEQLPATKQAPGLPTPEPTANQSLNQPGVPGSQQYSQYGRFGQQGSQEQSGYGQKPYDAFSQQAPSTTPSTFENTPAQQSQTPTQPQAQQQSASFSSAPSDYSQYYTTADQQRNAAYQNYYGQQYGQQQHGGQSQPDAPQAQRSLSGYNGPQSDSTSQYPQSSSQQSQPRFPGAGEGQNSGHSTPNPTSQSQAQQPASQTAQHQPGHPQQHGQGGFPYGHPYYSSPYYAAYLNQYQQGYNQGSYGMGPYGAKGGMYNHQPHQGYGMSPQTPYDHTASPAAGSFGQSSLHGRDSGIGSLSDYGRASSTQSSQQQGLGGSSAFGGSHDPFGRTSSYQGQGQHYGQQGSNQQGATSDDLKPFGDNSKSTNGPSPSLSQAGRPGSATNNTPGQSGLPTPQSQQSYGGYPSHLQQQQQQQQQHGLQGSQSNSQYSGLGGAGGGHQGGGAQGSHQNSQYGGYAQHGFGSYYGNNQQRGGWGGN